MILKTGDYLLRFYTKAGSHLKGCDCTAKSFQEARQAAEDDMELDRFKPNPDGISSYTIDRRIFNSLEESGSWEPD